MKKKIVMKFGGTSNGSVSAIKRIVKILYKNNTVGHKIAVVVSAASGVTNALYATIFMTRKKATLTARLPQAQRSKISPTIGVVPSAEMTNQCLRK